MNKTWLGMVLLGGAVFAGAAEIVEIKELKDWAPGSAVRSVGDGAWEVVGNRDLANAKSFKVDPAKKYTLSFEMRKTPETQKVLVYAGFWPLNEDMVRIEPHFVRCERNSGAKLTADAAAGSKTIRITQPKRWKEGAKTWCVSFRDQAECKTPDFEVICNRSCSDIAADGSLEVTLAKPLPKDYPAGTPIHFHSDGPGMYSACDARTPTDEWETFSCTVTRIKTGGIPVKEQWWDGTKYAKLRFLTTGADKNGKVEFRNIRLTEEE